MHLDMMIAQLTEIQNAHGGDILVYLVTGDIQDDPTLLLQTVANDTWLEISPCEELPTLGVSVSDAIAAKVTFG